MPKGIIKIQGGYRADHYWGKPAPLSESFYIHTYGSDDAAKAAAGCWLEQMAKEFPAQPILRKPGVFRTAGQIQVHWTSYPNEVKHNKKFSYNNDIERREAEHKAKVFLDARIREFETFTKGDE